MATTNVQKFAGDVDVGGTVTGDGSGLTTLNGSQVTTGTVAAARIDNLDGSKITTGTVAAARIDNLDGSKITTGNITRPVDTTGDVKAASLYTDDFIYHDGDTNTNIRFPAADTITMETGGSERMRVDSSGYVGIGTDNPISPLQVNGDTQNEHKAIIYCRNSAAEARVTLRDEKASPYIPPGVWGESGGGLAVGTRFTGIKFYASENGNAETLRMFISGNGRVGIGTATPRGGLDVNKAQNGTMDVNNGPGYSLYTWSGQGRGYNDPGVNCSVNGDAGNMIAHGFYAGYSVNFLSDRRIKKDIQEIQDDEALIKLRQLKPSKYKYKEPMLSDRTDAQVYGFIAQEVAEVYPEAVEIGNSEELDQAHIPNIMSICRVDVESIDASAYENLSSELQGEYTLRDNTFVRNILTITDTLDTDTFSNVGYRSATETKTTSAIETNEEGEYHPLIFCDKHNMRIRANVLRVIDASSFVVDTLLDEETLLDDNKILLYGQLPDDFHRLNKDAIFTLGTSALQEVDRQLQDIKGQLTSVLTRLDALESA